MAIRSVLAEAGIRGADVEHVAISRAPAAHLWRKALFALTHRPDPKLILDRVKNSRKVRAVGDPLRDALGLGAARSGNSGGSGPTVHQVEHHPAHLASAFFVSSFADAACSAIDG